MKFALPILWVIGGAVVWVLGAWGASLFAAMQADATLYDPYYADAHRAFAGKVVAPFPLFALIYLLLRRPNPWLAGLHFAMSAAAAAAVLAPAVLMGLNGMPVRYAEFHDTAALWSAVSNAGYILAAISLVAFLAVLAEMFVFHRPRAA